ncbi:hypothetical protein AAC387_Pa08g1050 [Persea americana]
MGLSEASRIPPGAGADKDAESSSSSACENPPSPDETPVPAGESVVDVSGERWDIISPFSGRSPDLVDVVYVYKNVFNLIPRSVGRFGRLKTLKFFANEVVVFPPEAGELVELERLQVKVASPGLLGFPVQRLKALNELELSLMPPRLSAFKFLSEISALKCLKKLSVCHFSIRYLPPEIGCLEKLEDLDLSFNKLKNLPNDIAALSALKSLRVANNKLIELPSGLSSLQRLVNLDFSNNRLTSLKSLKLDSMTMLQNLNLQNNKLPAGCKVPLWICCNLEGNGQDASGWDINSLAEEDAFNAAIHRVDAPRSSTVSACRSNSSNLLSDTSSITRSSAADRMRKGWRRRDFLQQRARQERLNTSRKWRGEDHHEIVTEKMAVKCSPCKRPLAGNRSSKLHCDVNEKKQAYCLLRSSSLAENNTSGVAKGLEGEGYSEDDCSCIVADSMSSSKVNHSVCNVEDGASSASPLNKIDELDGDSSSEASKNVPKSKRHSDRDLDSPKPRKCQRPVDGCSNLSYKYSIKSFCCSSDRLPDGFYDAGRDCPFMPLQHYEQGLRLDSREVILVDRERDEDLDAIVLTAQVLVSSLKQSQSSSEEKEHFSLDNLQRASLLALFVSDCFGGSDRSNSILRMRKIMSGSNYEKPFVCTCATGNNFDNKENSKEVHHTVEHFNLYDLCEKSLRFIKETRNSNVVPIGTLRFGVCRHRAVLMKYLCDRVDPPIPCELVRGYLDFRPHAWNNILVRRGSSLVRMVVDACHPTDIREETDPEFFCRYIPLTHVHVPVATEDFSVSECSFPSLLGSEFGKTASSSVIQCKFGSTIGAVKFHSIEVNGTSDEEVRNFVFNHLGEVRMLGALRKHTCIVEIYGHQLSSKWVPATEGKKEQRLLQSAIMMEFIKGGSLKSYMDKLAKSGMKHVPVKLALFIARDIACALAEVHSKHIIHRDVKSENILIDLDSKRIEGSPVVKLCDFDRAVPLMSYLHTCCIAHHGIHPADVCVGTPRWMAPEVLKAMHGQHRYGLEVDIWSYGCVLLELLTLQIPYAGFSDSEFAHLLQMNRRPRLTDELESLISSDEPTMTGSDSSLAAASETDAEMLKFLVDLFVQCTDGNPSNRPTAVQVYEMLCSVLPLPDPKS